MRLNKTLLLIALVGFLLSSCADQGEEIGTSTPIDSTNLNGTAPATYGGDDPANDQDTTYANSNDTGTRMSNGPENNGR